MSSVDFFNRTETRACFCDKGRFPAWKLALQRRARIGANYSAARFRSHVGTGSRGQCFAGDLVSNLAASSTVTGCRVEKVSEFRLLMTDGEAQDVD